MVTLDHIAIIMSKEENLQFYEKLGFRQKDRIQRAYDIQGFESYSVPYPKSGKSWVKFLTNIKAYERVCEKLGNVEMIILYNFQAIAMKKIMSYCKKNAIKCCADITEWRSAKGENIVYRIIKDSDTWYRMHILHKRLDGLIVISTYLEDYYKNCKNVIYIPALVDCREDKWKNNYEKSMDSLKLVYAGNPGRKDRLDKLIAALDETQRPYLLDIIGMTSEQYLEYYPEHNNILKKHADIIFHGRISHLETLEYVKKANYSCFLRENDRVSRAGFPTKYVEAITCGTPVFTNATSNLRDYTSNDLNGILLKQIDVDSIRLNIEKLPFITEVNNELFDYMAFCQTMMRFLVEC